MAAIVLCSPAAVAEDRYNGLIDGARSALDQNRTADARRMLAEAEAISPETLLVAYYRAYCDYRDADFPAATAGFRAALRIDPGDGWSAYMLALSLAKSGDLGEARRHLMDLTKAHGKDEIGTTAEKTIGEIEALERESPGRWALAGEAGVLADTNPAFHSDSAGTGQTDAALALSVRAEFALFRDAAHRLAIGAAAGGTVYFMRNEPADWTTFSGWLGYRRSSADTALLVSYRYDFSLYRYDPFTSIHGIEAGYRAAEAPWTVTAVDAGIFARLAHNDTYGYLAARGATVSAGQEFGRSDRPHARAGYVVRFEKADPASVHQEEVATDQAGAAHALTADYRTDYSFFGHGPTLSAGTALPAGFSIEASADLSWRTFPHADRVVYADGGVVTAAWEKRRNDTRVYAEGTLGWTPAAHATLLLRAAYLRNLSTLGDDPADPIDRNYGRFMVGLFVRGALNPADL